jgi:hypothetical protein
MKLMDPVDIPSAFKGREKRDPRYDALQQALRKRCTGLMKVIHMEKTSRFGLALFASEGEALDACKAIAAAPDDDEIHSATTTGRMVLRIIEHSKPAYSDTYSDVVDVEGDAVPKDDLAPTSGLWKVYRNEGPALWCKYTKQGSDCPYGSSCFRIHLKKYQVTHRRKRNEESGGSSHDASARWPPLRSLEESLIPKPFRMDGLTIRCSFAVVRELLNTSDPEQGPSSVGEHVVQQVERLLDGAALPAAFILKIDTSEHGSPFDWALHCPWGRELVRKQCPFPRCGMQTPLARDAYQEGVLRCCNALTHFTSLRDALYSLSQSPRTRAVLERYCASQGEENEEGLTLILQPALSIPSVLHELSIFIEKNASGPRVRCCIQRYEMILTARSQADRDAVCAKLSWLVDFIVHELTLFWSKKTESLTTDLVTRDIVINGACVADEHGDGVMFRVLSIKPAASRIQDSLLFSKATAAAAPVWNVKTHYYTPLFPRSLLLLLQ